MTELVLRQAYYRGHGLEIEGIHMLRDVLRDYEGTVSYEGTVLPS
jgi:hypothetical protein